MIKASADSTKKCKVQKIKNDYELNEDEILFFTKIRRLTENEEKLISVFDKLNFTCNLFDVKKIIFNFSHLTELSLNYISLELLPNHIKNLYNLMCLDLSNNKLKYLPRSLALLQRLTWLNLSNNEFPEVPNLLYFGLRLLKILDLSYNAISEFKEPPGCIDSILQFRMSNNALNEIPPWIFSSLCHLEMLDLSVNPIKNETEINVNPWGGINTSLQILNIENCNLIGHKLQYLKHLQNLEILHMGNRNYEVESYSNKKVNKNFLGTLTMDIFKKLNRLKCLYMENNDIVMLPQEFGQLQCVQYLNLSGNMLSWLPDTFCDLVNLKVLFLSFNQLMFLPENIGNLMNLEQIHLSGNKISKLPECFCKLHNLKYIDLYNNEITKIDSLNFKEMKMLSGIDLEMNFLDLDEMEWVNLNLTKEKYFHLKTCFRKQFHINDRHDFKKINKTADLEEIIYSAPEEELDESNFNEEEIKEEKKILTFSYATEKNNAEESETWEEISAEYDKHSFFEPRFTTRDEDKVIKCPLIVKKYSSNYCPADYHASSLLNFCQKNFASFNEVVEGQFDSQ